MDQLVLSESGVDSQMFDDTLVLLAPIACGTFSFLLLLAEFLASNLTRRSIAKLGCWPLDPGENEESHGGSCHLTVRHQVSITSGQRSLADRHRAVRFMWKTLRLLACVSSVALTIFAIVATKSNKLFGANNTQLNIALLKYRTIKYASQWINPRWSVSAIWIEISLCIFYVSTWAEYRDAIH